MCPTANIIFPIYVRDEQPRFNQNTILKWSIEWSQPMTGMSLSTSSGQIGIGCGWSSFITQMRTSSLRQSRTYAPGPLGSYILTSSSCTRTTSRSFHIGTLAFLIAGCHDFAHRLSSVDQVCHLEDVLPNLNKTFSLSSPYCWCLVSSNWHHFKQDCCSCDHHLHIDLLFHFIPCHFRLNLSNIWVRLCKIFKIRQISCKCSDQLQTFLPLGTICTLVW
jgi:hypothetical protein